MRNREKSLEKRQENKLSQETTYVSNWSSEGEEKGIEGNFLQTMRKH